MPHYNLMIVPKKMVLSRSLLTVLVAFGAWCGASHANEVAFRADLTARVKAADKNYDTVVQGRDGWLFFAPELRSVSVGRFWGGEARKVSRAVRPENADPLPAILDFKAQLDKAGVKLLLVPVPPKSIVYADKVSSRPVPMSGNRPQRLDSAHQEFYRQLRSRGVSVLDLTGDFLNARQSSAVFCKQDTHWSPRGINLAASAISRRIGNLPGRKAKYSARNRTLTIKGDLWDALPANVKKPTRETLSATYIGTPDPKNRNNLLPVPTSRNSPVLLLGDSHTLVFHAGGDMHAKGAGLADQLAYRFGQPVDLLGVRGSGATPARVSLMRRIKENPNYLKNKKWVVWCFSATEFTESAGWQKVVLGGGR
jgi:hypothetical protein